MPKVAKGRRKRAYQPKTRSGCLTCKVRRIKCDETRPACLRCTSTRRACDGYAPESSCSSFFSSPSGFSPGSLLLLNQVDRGPSLNIHPCDQSARSFSFFAQYTCHQLAGFFESPFWERLVLQTTHQEPAIRHAVTAIGSLHMQQKGNLTLGPLNTEKTFALVQYNLAIRHLLTPRISKWQRGDNRAPIDVCLILSILFTCFENMQGHHKAAGCHIRGGAKLLIEAVYDAGSGLLRREVLATQSRQNPYVPLEVLANFFAGLNDDAAMVIRDYKFKTYEHHFFTNILEGRNDAAFEFTSIAEARDAFEYGHYLLGRKANSSESQSPHDTDHHFLNIVRGRHAYTTHLLSTFTDALDHFRITKYRLLTAREQIAVMILQLQVLYIRVSLTLEEVHSLPSSCAPCDVSDLDEMMLPHMSDMVELGENIISTISSEATDVILQASSGTTSFYMGQLGYIIPLYTVASLCKDSKLRRRAIALLRATSRQEGLWNSIFVAKACERIMEIEEKSGVKMAASVDADLNQLEFGHHYLEAFPSVLRLDASGGHLQYELQSNDGLPLSGRIIEKVFDW